jgi:hypothetical protein
MSDLRRHYETLADAEADGWVMHPPAGAEFPAPGYVCADISGYECYGNDYGIYRADVYSQCCTIDLSWDWCPRPLLRATPVYLSRRPRGWTRGGDGWWAPMMFHKDDLEQLLEQEVAALDLPTSSAHYVVKRALRELARSGHCAELRSPARRT